MTRDLHCTNRTRSVQIRFLGRLFESDEPFAAGQADRTVIIEVLRCVDVAAFRAYEEPAAVRPVAPGTPATLHQDGVPQVRGGCPDQHPRRIAVAFPQGAADLRAVRRGSGVRSRCSVPDCRRSCLRKARSAPEVCSCRPDAGWPVHSYVPAPVRRRP